MASETAPNQSPLAALLYRSSRPRRASPLYSTNSRQNSPILYPSQDSGSPTQAPRVSSLDAMEDSDDEGNAPQLSALARMLLSQPPEGSPERKEDGEDEKEQCGERRRSPLSRYRSSRNRTSLSRSPNPEEQPVQSTYATVQRCGSRHGSPEPVNGHDLVTPAPGRYTRRVHSGMMGSSGSSGSSAEANKETEARHAHTGFSTIARPGPRAGAVPPSTGASTTRWRRGLIGGLAGAPRRGPRRESDQTEEQGQEDQEAQLRNSSSPKEQGVREQSDGVVSHSRSSSSSSIPKDNESNPEPQPVPTISRRSRRSSPETLSDQYKLSIYKSDSPGDKNSGPSDSSGRSSSPEAGVDNSVPKTADSSHPTPQPEKEDIPPPTFRRPTVLASSYQRLASTTEKPPLFQTSLQDENNYDKPLIASPVRTSPEKRALAAKTNNTPLRPAPPPPKMSMLQAVTATAGAASTTTSQTSRRSRATVSVNGKVYRRLDAIGKGGSCKVYKVMAENFKTFAMKKVAFDGQDISAIRGYKGEIELLNKLAGEERVIRLYDYELNNDKQTLTMLMECGETDFAKILTLRHGNEDSQLDLSFVRYYWREMLQCVDVIHRHNVIHSDLKPANFLLVRGNLKLIDFGIANAIQDDTVNVHRESQVGTLNYMSPEAIVDINASSGRPMASVGQARLMKLGAPSDVWSLGCILYQMAYGHAPFANLTNMYKKIAAIPDPDHQIEYPAFGIGGVTVPRSLINTIKGCLDRDKEKRLTIRQMLSEEDPFLNPDHSKQGMVDISEDMLRLLLENAVQQIEASGKPDKATLQVWARDVYVKLGKRMEGQRPGYR